jgi:hypothetical protein
MMVIQCNSVMCLKYVNVKTRTSIFEMEHGEPPKTTVQPQSTWLWLRQVIRRVS